MYTLNERFKIIIRFIEFFLSYSLEFVNMFFWWYKLVIHFGDNSNRFMLKSYIRHPHPSRNAITRYATSSPISRVCNRNCNTALLTSRAPYFGVNYWVITPVMKHLEACRQYVSTYYQSLQIYHPSYRVYRGLNKARYLWFRAHC
jgi:hypothetical protein